MSTMSDLDSIECDNCGHEHRVMMGDLAVREGDDGSVTIYEVNVHGALELGYGDSIPDALRNAANTIES